MQMEALYDHGMLKFEKQPSFAHSRFRILVELPDEEVLSKDQGVQRGYDRWLSRLDEIKQSVLLLSENELPELTEKQKRNCAAFELREDR